MWEALLKFGASLVDFARGTRRNAEDIKKTNQRVEEMSTILLTVLMRLENLEKMEAKERQILILQLKNILLEHGIKPSQIQELNPALPPKQD
ncbi:MAG: hypothetical protein KY445_04930 [Armatimonadetes bacterium]|nr:hypothetical protein [Armatimonadota bacterium]